MEEALKDKRFDRRRTKGRDGLDGCCQRHRADALPESTPVKIKTKR